MDGKRKENKMDFEKYENKLEYPLREPCEEKIFAKAWGEGHSNGYQEVFYWLEELADLVK